MFDLDLMLAPKLDYLVYPVLLCLLCGMPAVVCGLLGGRAHIVWKKLTAYDHLDAFQFSCICLSHFIVQS